MKIKIKMGNYAAAEIVGSILLMAIAVSMFALIYMNVLSDEGPALESYTTITGNYGIDDNADYIKDIIFQHKRGESLGLDTEFLLNIAGRDFIYMNLEEDLLLESEDKLDGVWNIGEKAVYHPELDLTDVQIKAFITDRKTNSLVFWGTLQEGYVVPPYGLGGIWHFDDDLWSGLYKDVLDSSGNYNDGIAKYGARLVKGDGDPKVDPLDNNLNNVMSINSGFFDGTNDVIFVDNHYSLNIQDEITVEAWMKPLKSTIMRSTSGFDAQFGFNPDPIHVAGDIYAIVADGKSSGAPAGSAIAATFIIEEDGTIKEIIDESNPLIIDKPGTAPDIVKLSEEDEWIYYAIAYTGGASNNYAGFLKIIKINKVDGLLDGLFDETPKYEFDRPGCWADIINVNNDIFVIAYSDKADITKNGKIFVKTIKIDVTTGIVTPLDKFPIDDTSNSNNPNIIKVSDTIYAVAYRKSGAGYVSTVEINPSTGDIIPIGSEQFSTIGSYPDLIHISDDVYAISYSGNNDAGFVSTIIIDSVSGSISRPIFDAIFDSDSGTDSDIIHIQDNLYAIVYSTGAKGNPDGRVVKLYISPDGELINNIELVVDTFHDYFYHSKESDAYKCFTPAFVRVSEYIFAVAYRSGIPHEGLISTFKLLEDPTSPYQRGIFKSGAINIYTNQEEVFASIDLVDQETTLETEYQLHFGDITANNWYHVALTYDGSIIALYCHNKEGVLVNSVIYPVTGTKKIKAIGTGDYKLGHLFFGYIDEIAIQEHALPLKAPPGLPSIEYHVQNPGFFENEPITTG